jgi:hypothetical protein
LGCGRIAAGARIKAEDPGGIDQKPGGASKYVPEIEEIMVLHGLS